MKNQIVHGLLAGQPLCGFSKDVPAKWPLGNVFTDAGDTQNITCQMCKDRAQHLRMKSHVPIDLVIKVTKMADPIAACRLLLERTVDEACGIIDRMNHAQAGILVAALIIQFKDDAGAQRIVEQAKYLGIRGSQGPSAARDAHFRETGTFLV